MSLANNLFNLDWILAFESGVIIAKTHIDRDTEPIHDLLEHQSSGATIDRMLGHSTAVYHDCSYDRTQDATID